MSAFRRRFTGRDVALESGLRKEILFIAGLAAGVAFLLVIAAVLMYQFVYADRVYLGVTAMGVDLGGDTKAEAQARLMAQATRYAGTPMSLQYGGKEWKATPAELGLRFDVDKIVNEAYELGRKGGLSDRMGAQLVIWRAGVEVQPFAIWDQGQRGSFLSRLARQIDQPTLDARVIVQPDLQVRISPSQAGRKLNDTATANAIEQAFVAISALSVNLVVDETRPKIVDASAQEPKATAEKMLAAPLVLSYDDRNWPIERKEIQAMITFAQQDDGFGKAKLVPSLDDEKLKAFINKVAVEIDRKPMNARFDYSRAKLTVIRDSEDGLKVDVGAAVEAVKSQVATDQRTVTLPVDTIKPSVSAEDAGTLAAVFKDKIEEATTSYAGSIPERLHNVELAAKRLHGVVVSPGEIFSFNEELGSATIEAGFRTAWGIILREGNMQTVPSEAGGICQVSTTLFQAIFWAGYQIEERYWHLYWIPRYGVPPKGLTGLDSTVDAPYVDLKFKNNTSSPILIQTRTDGKNVTFSLYGQKPTWIVKVDPPFIEDEVKASTETVKEEDPTQPVGWSLWVEEAHDGFKSTIVRTVTDGSDVRTLRLISVFRPSRNVIRVGTKPVPVRPASQQSGQQSGQQPSQQGQQQQSQAVQPTTGQR
ncbi:MAG: VanW family protein [Chloroflexi bacterium]|nr:VanW family protein [Chloroflexota bacterium]